MKNQAMKLLILEEIPGNWFALQKESQNGPFPFTVTQASNIDDARLKITKSDFEVVVADYFLKDGVCTDLIPNLNGTPLIVMTQEGSEDIALLALKTGACDYLIKDTRRNYLKLLPLTVSKSLEQKNQADELDKYRTQLENIVEERTIELIEMYSKLQESETNFRNIFNSTNEAIIILDYDYIFIEANEAILNQFGITKEFLASHDILDFVVPEYKNLIFERIQLVRNGLPSGNMEVELISPQNGNILSYEISSVPIVFNQKNAILSIMHDINERKTHERKLFETIIQTEEEERTRIASDLHDEIGPLISALKIFTTSFIESSSPEKKDKLASQMSSIVRDVLESIKIISNDMSPHVLVNFGLMAAINNFIDIFSKNIAIHLHSNLNNTRFPSTTESLIYRIIKELINNTVKHAKATEIQIDLEYINCNLKCNYKDNGIGFNWKEQVESPAKGMGINNIITRIRSLGGDFEVHSEPKRGFEISFILHSSTKNAIE